MTAKLCAQRVEGPHGLAALADECTRLSRSMLPRSPFASSRWLQLWWRHFREDRLLVHDQFYVHAVRDERGVLLGLAPLLFTERPANGPLRCRSVTFFGGDKNVTELRGLICAPEHEAGVTRALLAHFEQRSDEWDWFSWNGVRRGSETHAVLSQTPHFEWQRELTDYVLPLPATWEEFRASRSRNIKESLRKCYNSLKRAQHRFEFRVVTDAGQLPSAVELFFDLHRRRARASLSVRHEDVFASRSARRLLLDLAQTPSAGLRLCAFQLEIAGKVVACRLGFLLGAELYLYFSGFDPEWAAFSVMTTTVAEAIKWAIERGLTLVNLSPGTDVSKTRWGATPVVNCEGVLISPTRRARLAFGVIHELNERTRPGTLLSKVVNVARRHA
jgi:CelD/BcsL family acetyltransferase involved in cellulose biosynthesis